jgi:catechol 2,3-dioxygenase-like lactoylglutathione lyase family enzyme
VPVATTREDRLIHMDEDSAPAVAGILETCLYARDLDAAATFYREVIGLDEFSRERGRFVFFRCGNAVLLLFNPVATRSQKVHVGTGRVPAHGATGPGHVAFRVSEESLSQWRRHLEAAGVEIESEVRWPRGGASLYLRDPAGNSVELASPTIWGLAE